MNGPDVYPYFHCPQDHFDAMCVGMTSGGKRQLANMLAHHCMPLRRDPSGWILTRIDLAMSSDFWHVSNDGKLSYGYKPNCKNFLREAPTTQSKESGK